MIAELKALVFIPFHLVWLTVGVGTPIVVARYARWRHLASARTAAGCCATCAQPLDRTPTYFVTGVRVCQTCANGFRRRMGGWMLGVATTISALLAVSSTALIADLLIDGREAWRFWTTGARLLFVGIPAFGVFATAATAIGLGRLANRLAIARNTARLLTGRDLPWLARVLASFELPETPRVR